MSIEGKTTTGISRRLRLGMVGGGKDAFIGGVHRIAARLDDRYELVAGALSSDPQRSRESAAPLHITADRAYDDYEIMAHEEMRRPDRIDVVAIVTPNHMHYPVAKTFLEAGFHVICDKPMTTSVDDAQALVDLVGKTGLIFALTHNYTAYPMIRQAREMVEAGALGKIRVVQVEYPQDWLATPVEESGQKQAAWRTDPARSGPAGCLGDIGTHAFNLAEFVSGLTCSEVAADLSTFVPGRRVDDNVGMLLRFKEGARGMLWASQVSPGNENALKLRVYGEKAGLEWHQEFPNQLRFSALGEPPCIIARSSHGAGAAAAYASRIPSGHSEGYLEAFAQLYTEVAEQITARLQNRAPNPAALWVPTVKDGLRGVQFIAATLASSQKNAAWVPIA